MEKLGLEFPLLWDKDLAFARQLGLVFEFPEELVTIYKGFGLDLPASNGTERWELPVPARYVIGTDGQVLSSDLDTDYTRRPEPEATLAVLKGA